MTDRIAMLNSVTRGWINYFSIGAMKGKMEKDRRTSSHDVT